MGLSPITRVLGYTAAFAVGSVVACPAFGLGAGLVAFGAATAAISGNNIAAELHASLCRAKVNSLKNHHLQELVGRALALCIECYEKKVAVPTTVEKCLPFLRWKDAELSALARAARRRWQEIELSGEHLALDDEQIHHVFTDATREGGGAAVLAADDWSQLLADLSLKAQTWFGDVVWLNADKRKHLAEFVAERFGMACRELVKADLDPSTGTGGRVFVALHLDMMSSLTQQVRAVAATTLETQKAVLAIQTSLGELRTEMGKYSTPEQKADCFDAFERVAKEIGESLAEAHRKLDEINATTKRIESDTTTLLVGQERQGEAIDDTNLIVRQLLAHQVQLGEQLSSMRSELAGKDGWIAEKDRRIAELTDAVVRVKEAAAAGDGQAAAALDAARSSGDAALLQTVLVRLRDERIDRIAEQMADAVKESREIAEIAYLRGDIAEAERSLGVILKADPNDLDAINRLGVIHHLRGDLSAAEKQYQRVLALDGSDGWRAKALGNLGNIAGTRGDLDTAEKLYREALEIDRKVGRLEGQANQLGNLGNVALTRGDLDAAEKLSREALAIYRKVGRLEGQANQLCNLGNIARTRGDLDAAEKLYHDALAIDRKLGRLEGQAINLGNLGNVALTRGDLDAAEKLYRESLDIERKLGRLEGQASDLGNLGNIAQIRGDLDAAEKLYRESLEINRKLGRLEGQAIQLGNLGVIADTRGDLDAAEKLSREALAIYRKVGRLEGQANQLCNLGNIARTRGDLDAAEKLYHDALAIDRKVGRLEGQARQLGNLGVIAETRGDLEAAEKLYREALEINRKLGRLEGEAIQLCNLGNIAEQRGRLGEARRLWTESRDLFAKMGVPHMVKQVQGWLDGLGS